MSWEEVTIGACRLIREDCRLVLSTLATVDALITDPPYGIALENHDCGRQGKRRQASYSIAGDTSQEAGLAVLAWAETRNLPTVYFAHPAKPWPGRWRNYLVWDKSGAVGGGGDPARCWKQTWELIQVTRNFPLNGSRDNAVLSFPRGPEQNGLHPAEKPVRLMRYLIEKITQPVDEVCDPFMGVGTTALACVQLGRPFIGIELDPHYFAIACRRIEEVYAQPDLFVPPPAPPPMQQRLFAEVHP